MLPLLLVLLVSHSVLANVVELTDPEKESLAKAIAEIKGNDVEKAVKTLSQSLQTYHDATDLKTTLTEEEKGEILKANSKLSEFKAPVKIENLESVQTDFFKNKTVASELANLIAALKAFKDADQLVAECNARPPVLKTNRCINPYASIIADPNIPNIVEIQKKYDKLLEEEVVLNVVLEKLSSPTIADQKAELIKLLKGEDPDNDETGILQAVAPTALPKNISEELKASKAHNPTVVDALRDNMFFLKSAGQALKQCQKAGKCLNSLSEYAMDDSYVKALTNAMTKYSKLPPLVPSPSIEPPLPTAISNGTNNGTDTETSTKPEPTTSLATKEPQDERKPCCMSICVIQPSIPSCQKTRCNNCANSCSCNRGCRSQSKCCDCKEKKCCEKKENNRITEVVEVTTKSSSTPMFALVSAFSIVATLLR